MLIKVIIENILSYFYLTVSKIDFEDIKNFTNKIRVKDLNYQLVRIGEKKWWRVFSTQRNLKQK